MPRQAPENEDDFLRMQQEAIRRVRDMQERARRTLENAGVTIERPLSNSANDSDMRMQDTVPLHEQTSAHRSEHQPHATSQHDQHEPMHGETNAHRSEHQPRDTSQHEPQVSHAGVTSSSVLNLSL